MDFTSATPRTKGLGVGREKNWTEDNEITLVNRLASTQLEQTPIGEESLGLGRNVARLERSSHN